MKAVRVSVPASSGNLGSGFDVLAAALDLRLDLEVELSLAGASTLSCEGEGASTLPRGPDNLVYRVLKRHLGRKPFAARVRSAIPLGRGLGSSGAARLAAHAAGLSLSGDKRAEEALRLAALDEGHPDNVAASFFGGLTAVLRVDPLDVYRVRIPRDLTAVVCVPDFELPTELAREALPEEVPLTDAVFNMSRALGWLAALESRDYSRLRAATEDSLHQPYRASLVPGLKHVIAAALAAGARGACLSGAGSSVLAVCDKKASLPRAAAAMERAFAGNGIRARGRIIRFDGAGLRISWR